MDAIAGLKPEGIWRYFQEISQIPRESGNEGRIREYLITTAKKLSLAYQTDAAGNVLVIKPGTAGSETVILQAHMDMVCEKKPETAHDFNTDPIILVRDDGWIQAEGTTLGADDGIGMAAMLALMEDPSLEHPNLEMLFTVEEETGLTGASMLRQGFITGKTLINLDSEDDGIFYIGCAGGRNTDITLECTLTDPPAGYVPASIAVTGLRGGHSGIDINKGRGNAIKLVNRFIKGTIKTVPFHLASIEGGSRHNVIPRDARAMVYLDEQTMPVLKDAASRWTSIFARELEGIDEKVKITVLPDPSAPQRVIVPEDVARILDMISILPHGVLSMNESKDNLVITSTNLAVCSMDGSVLKVKTNQRSIYTTSVEDASDMIQSIGRILGARVTPCEDYPAWRPDFNSRILSKAIPIFESLFGKPPLVKVIHAGLECGVIGEKIPGMDMISIGPTVEHAHSPSERVNIETVGRMWEFITNLLANLSHA
ncbi:MAG TPA: aminoacyl-histidine dipeptidase [Deltaproteobacteria bacterium]|nr:aminoacyl-histidine dipeptidase [Deltaproteobacteria bacterium]